MKPQTITTAVAKKTRPRSLSVLCRADALLRDCFPAIEPNTATHYASAGVWSMHDLIFHLLTMAGPCALTVASWSMSREAAEQLTAAVGDGRITAMTALFDWRVQVRCPEAAAIAKHAATTIKVSVCHAKVALLRNDNHAISIISSANLTNNPRIEAGVVCTDLAAYEFHHDWISREVNNAKPFGIDLRRRSSDTRQ